jgi:hypothetical protein
MPTKSALSGTRRANITGFREREPLVEGLAMPQTVESGNLRRDKSDMRWMSV